MIARTLLSAVVAFAFSLSAFAAEPTAPNYGFLSSRVDHLILRLDDGSTVQIPVLESPPGWDGVQAFLFFPPNGTDGTLIAYSKDGMELASAQICKYSQVSGGCGGVVKQLAPISRT